MGNCSSCVPSHIQVNDYQDNALHFPSSNSSHKVGSVHSHEGQKGVNQDAAILYEGYGTEDSTFCAVFDGHGAHGHIVSKVVRNQLPLLLQNQKGLQEWEWNKACETAFNTMDNEVKLLDHVDLSFSGSTAVVVVKQGQDLVIANLGDSRAVVGTLTKNGIQAIRLTVDLKPDLPAEKERIERCKGRVFAHSNQPHIQRAWLPDKDELGLATSRAFGDFAFKSYGIIAIPDVSHRRLTPEDQFLVLASDGVWDVLSDDEVASIVSSTEKKETAAKAVVDEALAAWKRKWPNAKIDDCSVVCLFLQGREDNLLRLNN